MIPALRSLLRRASNYYERHGFSSLIGAAVDDVISELGRLPPHYRLYSLFWNLRNGFGTYVTDLDWDVLVVLDACRFDALSEASQLDGPTESRIAVGSNTTEYFMRNFGLDTHHDTVYVTANPKAIKLEQSYLDRLVFHDLIDVTSEEGATPGYVSPEAVAEAARDALDRYPDKRLVVHFNQPHEPYSGPTAERVREEFGLESVQLPTLRPLVEDGELSLETVRTIYRENLSNVLEVLDPLVAGVDRRTVITADHGELLGERLLPSGRRWYGHPKRLRCEELCVVPVVTFDSPSRPSITAKPPQPRRDYDLDAVDQRLEHLGYVQ